MMKKYTSVEAYIAGCPKEVQGTLAELRRVIKKAAPKATEKISYGMPFYEYGGSGIRGRLVYFAAFKKHISLFIMPWHIESIPSEMKKYHVSKATYKFSLDTPLPLTLIKKTVTQLVRERN